MKRCFFIIGFVLCLLSNLCAQVLQVDTFASAEEINWVPTQRLDDNGVPCALIRVAVPFNEHVQFMGNVVGSVEYKVNEYWVYLMEESIHLRVHYPGCKTLLINFKDFGCDGVESKGVYELELDLPDELRYNMPREEFEQLTAQAALLRKQENFTEAIASYEACKRKLADKGEHGYVREVQEQINYCKRRITLKQLNADGYRTPPSDGLCCYKVQEKFGFVDSVGNVVVPPIYDEVLGDYDFHDGIAWVKKDSLWGSINTRGEVVVSYTYAFVDRPAPFSYKQNRCLLARNPRQDFKVIDYMTGEEVLSDNYSYYYRDTFDNPSCDYFCLGDSKERAIFIDKKSGKLLFSLPSKMQYFGYFGFGYSLVSRKIKYNKHYSETKIGIVDGQGQFLFPCEYKNFEHLEQSPQFVIAKRDLDEDRWGDTEFRLFNLKQRVYVGGTYTFISNPTHSRTSFVVITKKGFYDFYRDSYYDWEKYDGKWHKRYVNFKEIGVLNYMTGEEVIKPSPNISSISLPLTSEDPIVAKDRHTGEFHLYNQTGKKYVALLSDEDLQYSYGYTPVKRNGKYGYANAKGELILDCLYDVGNPFNRHGDILAASVEVGEESYYVTPEGKRIENEVIKAMHE